MDVEEQAANDWVEKTRKRLHEEQSKRDADRLEAAAKRRADDKARMLATFEETRARYPFYTDDLKRIKTAIERLVPQLHLDELCWLFFSRDGIRVCLTEKLPPRLFPSERLPGYPFRCIELIRWSAPLPIRDDVCFCFGSDRLLDVFTFDITHWATRAGLKVSPSERVSKTEVQSFVPATEDKGAHYLREWGTAVRLPFAQDLSFICNNEDILTSFSIPELNLGDMHLAMCVPLEPPQTK